MSALTAKRKPVTNGNQAQPVTPIPTHPTPPPEPAEQESLESPPAVSHPSRIRSLLTQPLGLEGWEALEPVVLASLISGDPLLLVGRHGTAKSFLLERLATSLGLVFRFYNASLVNYDDLVGIPLPNEDQTALRYISTPSSIWDAEVVFIDELSRARPELQNKLFPIIHERRVQGVDLHRLRYRWAAMNPPPARDAEDDGTTYFGAEPLDPALADRFAFIVEAPGWENLNNTQRRSVLLDQFRGPHEFPVTVEALVSRGQELFQALTSSPPETLADYLIALAPHAATCGHPLSTRRVTMLLRSILAVQAARTVLAEFSGVARPDWEDAAWLAFRHGLPGLAQGIPIQEAALYASHRQAWRLCALEANDPWKQLLAVADPAKRLALACRLGEKLANVDFASLVSDALASQPVRALRTTLALVVYLRLRLARDLPGIAVEMLAGDLRRVLAHGTKKFMVHGSQLAACREVASICGSFTGDSTHAHYERDAHCRNLLNGLLPDGFEDVKPEAVHKKFNVWWKQFGLINPHGPNPS